MTEFDEDDKRYERQIFFMQKHLRSVVASLNEVLTIGRAIENYEAAYDVAKVHGSKGKSDMFLEMAEKYKEIIFNLRNAEEFLEIGIN